jgi:hypothetical protein
MLALRARRAPSRVSTVPLQYSTSACASSGRPRPRLTAIIGVQPMRFDNDMNSSVPKRFGSQLIHAHSNRLVRDSRRPTPSRQL